MQSALNQIRQALLTVTDRVYHYHAWEQSDKYIVWAEDNEYNSVEANNRKEQQTIEGTIDYFTKTEDDPLVDEIQGALNDAEISFRLNLVQYEDETEYIHYEWVWQVVA